MTESLKFGPEWLRNSIATSPTKQEETISRPILSDFRYSQEEMLSLCEKVSPKPEILPLYQRMYVDNWQTPLAFHIEEDKDKMMLNTNNSNNSSVTSGGGRLFLNSNIKKNWRTNSRNIFNSEEKQEENWRNKESPNKDTGIGVFYDNKQNSKLLSNSQIYNFFWKNS